jgi:hypothetical protein
MKKGMINTLSMDNYLGCFGNFNIGDPICKKFCALSLRCAIERDQMNRVELLEDLMYGDDLFMKTQ